MVEPAHPLSCLEYRDPAIYRTYVQAERLVTEDPGAACVKLRIFTEAVVARVYARLGARPGSLADALSDLRRRGLSPAVLHKMDALRVAGNRGAHEATMSATEAVRSLSEAHAVGAWLAVTYLGVPATEVGRFEDPEPAATLKLYRDAILDGDPDAQYQVAMILLHRTNRQVLDDLRTSGVAFNGGFRDAVEWLRRAQLRVPAARSQLALLFLRKLAPAGYDGEAMDLLGSASDADDPQAHATLGQLLLRGEHGVAVDYEAARRHFEVAAEQDHLEALNALVKMHAEGLGMQPDSKRALGYARRAAEAGYELAQYNLALLLVTHEPPSRARDAEILDWLTKAAKGGVAAAMHELYRAYRDGHGVTPDKDEAARWRELALTENEPRTCFDMGMAYEVGDGVVANTLTARRFYERASLAAAPEQAQLAQDARAKMRMMALRNRDEIMARPPRVPPEEFNERLLIELGVDDSGDPVPGFVEAFARAMRESTGKSPREMVLAVAGVNPSAARRMGLA